MESSEYIYCEFHMLSADRFYFVQIPRVAASKLYRHTGEFMRFKRIHARGLNQR